MAIIMSAGSWSIVSPPYVFLTGSDEWVQLRGSPEAKSSKEADELPMHERAERGDNAALAPLLADDDLDTDASHSPESKLST